MTTTDDQENRRRICEARGWLRDGYTTRAKVDELMVRITRRRGKDAAEALREEMRRQWAIRDKWMEKQA